MKKQERFAAMREILSTAVALVFLLAVIVGGVYVLRNLSYVSSNAADSGESEDILTTPAETTVPTIETESAPTEPQPPTESLPPTEPLEVIGEEAAMNTALSFLNYQREELEKLVCSYDDTKAELVYYRVSFHVGVYRYEVLVHGVEGTILSVNLSEFVPGDADVIGSDEAIRIALQQASSLHETADGICCARTGSGYVVSYIIDGNRMDVHVSYGGDVVMSTFGASATGKVEEGLHVPMTKEQALKKLLESDVLPRDLRDYVLEDPACRATVEFHTYVDALSYMISLYRGEMVYDYFVDLYSGNVCDTAESERVIATPEQALETAINYSPWIKAQRVEIYKIGTEYNRTFYLLQIHDKNTYIFMIDADSLNVMDVWAPFPENVVDEQVARKAACSCVESGEVEYLLALKGVFNDGQPFYCVRIYLDGDILITVVDAYSGEILMHLITERQ